MRYLYSAVILGLVASSSLAASWLAKELEPAKCTSFAVIDTAKQTTHIYKRERACAWESGEYKPEVE